jgi:3-oxoadipate enol-lactonase
VNTTPHINQRRDTYVSRIRVNDVELWHRITGDGEPVIQIHGSGFGHFNFDPVTPLLADSFRIIDYDQRGYGESDRPVQPYDMEVWADDVAGLLRALGIERAHIHGTSMGGMVALVFAGKYPELTQSVVINCAAAKSNTVSRLLFKNHMDIVALDPDGVGSRLLAELVSWQALSARHLASPEGAGAADHIQQILRDSNRPEVFTAACQAVCDMDLTPWFARVQSPALVIGGNEDIMTPWDQSPDGVGQQAIYEGIAGAEKRVLEGSAHSSIFDATDAYAAAVKDFLVRHADGNAAGA